MSNKPLHIESAARYKHRVVWSFGDAPFSRTTSGLHFTDQMEDTVAIVMVPRCRLRKYMYS
jgi:hypothetical protein